MQKRCGLRRPRVGLAAVTVTAVVLASWSWQRAAVRATASGETPQLSGRELPIAEATGPAGVRQREPLATVFGHSHGEPANPIAPERGVPTLPPVAERRPRDPGDGVRWPNAGRLERPVLGAPADDGGPAAGRGSDAVWDARLARRDVSPAPEVVSPWPWPATLASALNPLRGGVAASWSESVTENLRQLHTCDSLSDARVATVLDDLQRLSTAAVALAAEPSTADARGQLLRVSCALERRLAVWRAVHNLARPAFLSVSLSTSPRPVPVDAALLERHVEQLARQVARLEHAAKWHEYLLLDQLRDLADPTRAVPAATRSQLARDVLLRLESAQATPAAERYFASGPWQELANQLRHWVVEPVDYALLLSDLERLEQTGAEEAIREVAGHYERLRWSSSPQVLALAEAVNTHYRNANVRVAVAAELVNMLLPNPDPVDEDVDDMLLGGRIFGRSRVSTRLRLVLLPDRQQWKMALEAQGHVNSQTSTKRGPALFHNAGRARYQAVKLLTLDHRGLRSEDAEAAAVSHANLTGLETDVDAVPLVNLLVRAIARQQYDSQSNAAKWEAEGLLAHRAQTRLNAEVDRQVDQATARFRTQLLEPLQRLGLRPEAVELETTDQRLIARYRLAALQQLAAYTPRPQAPTDSLLSVQVHESAMNNILASLALNTAETDLPTLLTDVARKFNRSTYQVPEDIPGDVRIRLAEVEPIRIRCSDERIHVALRIAKLASGNDAVWRDIEVRASYLPRVQGLSVRLVRDGPISLKGRRLSMRDQVALRGIFSRVLAQNPDIDVLASFLARDRRLQDLRVTQIVLQDGWIGLSIGRRAAARAGLADDAADRLRG